LGSVSIKGALHDVTQPDHSSFKRLAVGKPERLPSTRPITLWAVIVDDALRAGDAVYRGKNQRAEFVD
jgi:hypothetical protein